MSEPFMTFNVHKLANGKWAISRVYPGWITGIGSHYKSKKAAVTVARLLAGHSGQVVVK